MRQDCRNDTQELVVKSHFFPRRKVSQSHVIMTDKKNKMCSGIFRNKIVRCTAGTTEV